MTRVLQFVEETDVIETPQPIKQPSNFSEMSVMVVSLQIIEFPILDWIIETFSPIDVSGSIYAFSMRVFFPIMVGERFAKI